MRVPQSTIEEAKRRANDPAVQGKKKVRRAKQNQDFQLWQEGMLQRAKGLRERHAQKPVAYNGNTFDAGPESQQKITSKITYAQSTGKADDGSWAVGWKTAENGYVELSYAGLVEIMETINDQIQAAYNREAQLAEQIQAASTIEELQAIGLESGWP